jgi:hypothetical protein
MRHRLLTAAALTGALLLAASCSSADEEPDVSAYCPAEEALINAQVALKTTNEGEALAEQLDEVEELTRAFQEEAPDLIEDQADVVAEETYAVLEEIRDEELSPADASDRLTGQFADEDVSLANAVIQVFDDEFCPEFEGTIPNIPDPAVPLPGVGGEVPTTLPPDESSDDSTP